MIHCWFPWQAYQEDIINPITIAASPQWLWLLTFNPVFYTSITSILILGTAGSDSIDTYQAPSPFRILTTWAHLDPWALGAELRSIEILSARVLVKIHTVSIARISAQRVE